MAKYDDVDFSGRPEFMSMDQYATAYRAERQASKNFVTTLQPDPRAVPQEPDKSKKLGGALGVGKSALDRLKGEVSTLRDVSGVDDFIGALPSVGHRAAINAVGMIAGSDYKDDVSKSIYSGLQDKYSASNQTQPPSIPNAPIDNKAILGSANKSVQSGITAGLDALLSEERIKSGVQPSQTSVQSEVTEATPELSIPEPRPFNAYKRELKPDIQQAEDQSLPPTPAMLRKEKMDKQTQDQDIRHLGIPDTEKNRAGIKVLRNMGLTAFDMMRTEKEFIATGKADKWKNASLIDRVGYTQLNEASKILEGNLSERYGQKQRTVSTKGGGKTIERYYTRKGKEVAAFRSLQRMVDEGQVSPSELAAEGRMTYEKSGKTGVNVNIISSIVNRRQNDLAEYEMNAKQEVAKLDKLKAESGIALFKREEEVEKAELRARKLQAEVTSLTSQAEIDSFARRNGLTEYKLGTSEIAARTARGAANADNDALPNKIILQQEQLYAGIDAARLAQVENISELNLYAENLETSRTQKEADRSNATTQIAKNKAYMTELKKQSADDVMWADLEKTPVNDVFGAQSNTETVSSAIRYWAALNKRLLANKTITAGERRKQERANMRYLTERGITYEQVALYQRLQDRRSL